MTQRDRPESANSPASSMSSASDATPGLPIEYCPNCYSKLYGHSCKLKCPRCGYFLSCSDYY